MSQVAEFKVAHLYPPYQGKGKASIVAHDGTKYKCEESALKQFREGEDVAIHYSDESFTNKVGEHVTFKKFVSKIARTNGAQKQFTKARMDPADARGAFVTVMCEAWATAGMLAVDEDAVAKARNAASRGYDKSHNPQHADDLNDDIPY